MKKFLFALPLVISIDTMAQILTTVAGNGTSGYSGDGGPATAAQFNSVNMIALDSSGNLYVSDLGNYAVRKISPAGIISTYAGGNGGGNGGDGGPATAAQLYQPKGLTFFTANSLYIADSWNNAIRVVNTSTGIINTFAGTFASGYSGDGGQATLATLNDPFGIAFDTLGNAYIADYGNHCIRKVNTSGIISTIAGNGTAGFSGDGGPATAAFLNGPSAIAVDAFGNIYVGDDNNNRIRKINTSGVISTICGQSSAGYSGDGGPASAASLDGIAQLNFDKLGNLFIAAYYNHAIRVINTSGIINTVAGGGSSGLDGGAPLASTVMYPNGIAIDPLGNYYFSESGTDRVRFVCATPDTVSGLVTEPNTSPVTAGQVYVYRQNLSHAGFLDTAGFTNINVNGTYAFADLPYGNYFVQAVPSASYTNALSSYYSSRVNNYLWDSATIVNHVGCANSRYSGYNITVTEFAAQTGSGIISGRVSAVAGYGGRYTYGNQTMGAPLKGVDVKLGKNPGGNAAARTTTDPAGNYTFTNVDTGSYFVFVDIPNFGMDTVLRIHLTTLDPNSAGNDYCVDSMLVNMCQFTTGTGSPVKNILSIYPNPAHESIMIRSSETGELIIYNALGEIVLQTRVQQAEEKIDLAKLPAGVYTILFNQMHSKLIKE